MEIIVFLVGLSASVYLGLGVKYIIDKKIQDGIRHLYFVGILGILALCLYLKVSISFYVVLTSVYIIVFYIIVYIIVAKILISKRQKKI